MKYEEIKLNVPYDKAGLQEPKQPAVLAAYVQKPQYLPVPRPAVIICPGGAYSYTSSREAEPIALEYLANGMQAFVLYYNCSPSVFPGSLLELAFAVNYVRKHAQEWNIAPDNIVIAGFSAGGHLAASLGCFWNREFVYGPLGLSAADIKPDGNLLGYPVITSGEYAHRGSFNNLLGDNSEDTELLKLVSLEEQVTMDNPPTFIWNTFEDQAVPAENSIFYTMALRKAGVHTEYHLFPYGLHGLSLANEETRVAQDQVFPKMQKWLQLSIIWIRETFRQTNN